MTILNNPCLIPLWIKLLYTTFMAVLVPVYLYHYGPTNFLYFCDVAAVMTLIAVWTESSLLCSAALVGIFVPQMVWVLDFFSELFGIPLTGMTHYMFDHAKPFYLRFLSFFHFWLPVVLIFLVHRLGYDGRGALMWTVLALILMPVCFYLMPAPGPNVDPNLPRNINYVYGFSEAKEQALMNRYAYFALMMVGLPVLMLFPTHMFFAWLMPEARG